MSNKNNKRWNIRYSPLDSEIIDNISIELGLSRILSTLIVNRGYKTIDEATSFIRKNQEILHDPYLLNDMDKAVERILFAIKNKEKITIYGDYDVDGVTSVSILYLYLKEHGSEVEYYIPNRKSEGYGVSNEAIEKLACGGTKLIITVDTGITAHKEAEFAKAFGVDMVITDHHECSDTLPNAIAVINPKRKDSTYPFQNLAGVGVAFKLLCALEEKRANVPQIDATRNVAYKYSDLTAIGTIADVMPVIDENRILISLGLVQAEKTDKIGLASLINTCKNGEGKSISKYKQKKKLSSGFVGFTLAPKINAAGRIDDASTAVELFLADSLNVAERYTLKLCEINRERQATENRIADQAFELIENTEEDKNSIIILDDCAWHQGVIGIVASRVSDKFGVPSILISFEGNENPEDMEAVGKGSGRSVLGMNIVKALSECSDLLEKFGGHELAAGLSIKRKNLEEFKRRMSEYAKKSFAGEEPERVIDIDCELGADDVNLSLIEEINCLEPYGVSNPSPVFAMYNVLLSDIVPVGMNRHLRLTFVKDKRVFVAMLFSTTPAEFPYSVSDEVDIAFTLDINEYNGVLSPQISIKDIHLSQRYCHFEMINEELYESAKNGECDLSADYIVPERTDFALVYNFLLNSARAGKTSYRYAQLLTDITKGKPTNQLSYVKLKHIIIIFRELNIVTIEENDKYSFSFHLAFSKNKTSLDKSNILKKLRLMYPKK